MIQNFDRDELKERFDSARPFRFMMIDDFLEPAFAREVAAAIPTFEEARTLEGPEGRTIRLLVRRSLLGLPVPDIAAPEPRALHEIDL